MSRTFVPPQHADRARSRRGRVVAAGVLAATGISAISAGVSPASSTTVRYPSEYKGSDPAVSDGRIWWMTPDTASSTTATLSSVRLVGGPTRRTRIELPPAVTPGTDPQQDGSFDPILSVRDGHAAVVLKWIVRGTLTPMTEPTYYAEYVAATGTPVRVVRDARAEVTVIPGDLPIDPQRAPTADMVAGDYALTFTGRRTSRYGTDSDPRDATGDQQGLDHDGWASATVSDRRTGRPVYSVSSRALARAAVPSHDDPIADVGRLLPDGSLAIYATRRSATDGHEGGTATRGDARPIRVDARGRIRVMGRAERGRFGAGGLYLGGRGLIVDDDRRGCRAWTVVDRTGRRGHRLAHGSELRAWFPVAWTAGTAVWPAPEAEPLPRDVPELATFRLKGQPYFAIDRAIDRLRLATRPRTNC